jgi:hypothetical protein
MRRLRRILIELARSERGIALPMALMITVIAMGFAAVPVVASINAQNGDSHNQGGNEALAAAEAGAELALLRQSALLTKAPAGVLPACDESAQMIATGVKVGWCPEFTGTESVSTQIGTAHYAYQVHPCYATQGACADLQTTETCSMAENQLLVQIVSTGYATVAGKPVTRRVELNACATKATDPRVITKELEIEEKKTEIQTWETPGGVAKEAQTVSKQNEVTEAETKLSEIVTEETTYKTEERETGELIERVRKEPAGVEYEEIPGETYYETTKGSSPNAWAGGQIVGIEGLVMNNNAQVYNGGAGSNKAVSMVGSANVCGTVSYGTTFTTDNSTSSKAPANCAVGRTPKEGTNTYPGITLPSNIATENSDYRLCSESVCHNGLDPVTSGTWQRENISYNAANKQLTIKYNALTLEGTAPYYLCQLVLAGGSSLYAGSGKSITIYFAPPSACGGLNGAPQLQIANGTYVYADASSGPKFLFVGNSSKPSESRIELAGGAKSEQFVIYAPFSQISINNGIEMTGAIVGNTIELAGGASINKYGAFTPPPSETFLPGTETKVEKHKPPTKVEHPSRYIKELEARLVIYKQQVATTENHRSEQQVIVTKLRNELTSIESGEAKNIAGQIGIKKTELGVLEKEKEEFEKSGAGKAKPLKRKSFGECSATPATSVQPPDEGC